MPIEVILADDVQGLGKAGQLVRVAPGYARNFLLPRQLAVHATDSNRKKLQAVLRTRAIQDAQQLSAAQEIARRLEALSLLIEANAGENGRLYGSVTPNDIADGIAMKGITIDRRFIQLEDNLRELGVYQIPVRLHPEVTATVQVEVIQRSEAVEE